MIDLNTEITAYDRLELSRAMFETGLVSAEPVEPASGRILVVDDDDAVRNVLVDMLVETGYDARGVSSAREARHALEHETVTLDPEVLDAFLDSMDEVRSALSLLSHG